ncbi:hypothetical protein FCL40_06655 [Ferrimonas sediminicola]|uniref:Uncharacterized protein n=1 Tax=Ferrimonas sediminicola TaxID=2569538 RepID=A0A4U1BGJ1_9GAMM|nr:hypothetical protein [Ferrimonas sediminicola]TKB49832.1 hypothetical protein FCL40_06655 [Ferrimonas sediminicola]
MLWLLLMLVSSAFFYVEACKAGLSPKRWGIAGFLVGPMLWPLFRVHANLALRRAVGRGDVLWTIK